MGCDIHLYVEYKPKKNTSDYWYNFGQRFNPGRNYHLFGLISKGVRYESENSLEPKGLPENLGFYSNWDYKSIISEDGEGENCCKLENAKKWIEEGYSEGIYTKDNVLYAVTNPDWHSHTWLTLGEFDKVLGTYYKESEFKNSLVEYEALLAAMKILAVNNNEVRLVIWFDN